MKVTISAIACFVSLMAYAQPEKITFQAPKAYPEGIAFDARSGLAYVSSVKTGTIGVVDAKGNYKEWYVDKTLKSTFGMKVDAKNNRLWVCAGDPNYSLYKDPATFRKMGRLVAIDLTTAKRVADIDLGSLLPGNHFPNDVTLDDRGNLYVTDSFSPVIYRIDSKGLATVWATNDSFKSDFIGLNGIAYHPGGFLLVAHNALGCVFKVDINDPKKVTRVKIPTFFPGADGLWVDPQNNLMLVQNKGVNKVYQLSSADQWETAKVVGSSPSSALLQNPTTCGWFEGRLYVLNAKLNELSDSTATPSDNFSFQTVVFK